VKLILLICWAFLSTTYVLCLAILLYKTVGIPICIFFNCAPLFTDLFLHPYEADSVQGIKESWREAISILKFHRPLHVPSRNNSRSNDFIDDMYLLKITYTSSIHIVRIQPHLGYEHYCYFQWGMTEIPIIEAIWLQFSICEFPFHIIDINI
jgi:hypothetical protein